MFIPCLIFQKSRQPISYPHLALKARVNRSTFVFEPPRPVRLVGMITSYAPITVRHKPIIPIRVYEDGFSLSDLINYFPNNNVNQETCLVQEDVWQRGWFHN
jgi:hypothetical protein